MAYPLRLYNTSDLRICSDSDQQYIAYLTGLELAASTATDPGVLTTSSSGNSIIGSFVNTYYNEAIGTHPGSSISTGSTTTSLYQVSNTTANENDSDFHFPLMWDAGISNTKEMTDSDFTDATKNILSTIMLNEYPGTYRLAAASPGTDYNVLLSNVFTDTTALNGSTTQYSIYKKMSQDTPVTQHRSIKVKRTGDVNSGDFEGLQVMTDSEIRRTFGLRAKNIIASTGVGTYRIRSAGEGAPTEQGTWVVRGQAYDTKNSTVEIMYPEGAGFGADPAAAFAPTYGGGATTYAIDYTGTTPGVGINYTRNETGGPQIYQRAQYALSFTGPISSYENLTYNADISPFATLIYVDGPFYTTIYTDSTSTQFTAGIFIETYANFTGPSILEPYILSYESVANFTAALYTLDYTQNVLDAYIDSRLYTGIDSYSSYLTNIYYVGTGYAVALIDYVGAIYVSDAAPTPVTYNMLYTGDQYYTGANFTAVSAYLNSFVNPSYNADYTSSYTNVFATDYTRAFTTTPIYSISRNYTTNDFIGSFLLDPVLYVNFLAGNVYYTSLYTATAIFNIVNEYVRENLYTNLYVQDYTSAFDTSYALGYVVTPGYVLNYAGAYNTDVISLYTRIVIDYQGPIYAGGIIRDYDVSYIGPQDYAINTAYANLAYTGAGGAYTGYPLYVRDYTGTSNYNGTGRYTGSYDGDGTTNFIPNYTRIPVFNLIVPTDYTALYASIYQQGLAIFEGTTIDAGISIVETYTLYCRVS